MKIQVRVEGDSFVFWGSQTELTELINAAVHVVYGEASMTYSLVDSLQMPVTELRHRQTYSVLKRQSPTPLPAAARLKREGLFFRIQPKTYFPDESPLSCEPRVQVGQTALQALHSSTGLPAQLIASLFCGSDALRNDHARTSRRVICVNLAGQFAWNFGDKCLGTTSLSDVSVEGLTVKAKGREFRLVSQKDSEAWRSIGRLDIAGFAFFLRSFEQKAIWTRWGGEFLP